MNITPDTIIYFQWHWITINATLVNTWIIMSVTSVFCWLITRNISFDPKRIPRLQHVLEVIVGYIRNQIREVMGSDPTPFIPFLGTLFLYISISNFLSFIPYYDPPTGSFSTTSALACCVFISVPFFGIRRLGIKKYLTQYFKPTFLMFPFKLIGELTRTLALAIRLFGNMMSGTLIVLILVSVTPLFVPVLMQILGLLIGQIQAYIFAILATIFIASGMHSQINKSKGEEQSG